MITGVDIVEQMIRITAGKPITFKQVISKFKKRKMLVLMDGQLKHVSMQRIHIITMHQKLEL
jgi:biotin carboxylase